jgi:hypothetical protein
MQSKLLSQPVRAILIGAAALLCQTAVAQQTPAGAAPATADKPLATVNGVAIPQKLYEQAVKQAIAQGNPDTPQLREAVKAQLIARELFVQEAAKQKLDKDPQVLAAAEEAKRNAMLQKYLQGQIQVKQVTEEDVKAHYEKAKAALGAKEFQLRAIMLNSEQRAREVRDQAVKGKDFAELARQWSLAPSATRGGEDPGQGRRDAGPAPADRAGRREAAEGEGDRTGRGPEHLVAGPARGRARHQGPDLRSGQAQHLSHAPGEGAGARDRGAVRQAQQVGDHCAVGGASEVAATCRARRSAFRRGSNASRRRRRRSAPRGRSSPRTAPARMRPRRRSTA